MKVVYTEEALRDLDAIADWLFLHYPAVAPSSNGGSAMSLHTSRDGRKARVNLLTVRAFAWRP